MKCQLCLMVFLLFLGTACGPIKSTTSIIKAENAKKETLSLVSRAAEDASIIERDKYSNESLNGKAKGEASYFYFKGDAYLKKAREFQAGALYENACKMADKSIEYFATASAMVAAVEFSGKESDSGEKKDSSSEKEQIPLPVPEENKSVDENNIKKEENPQTVEKTVSSEVKSDEKTMEENVPVPAPPVPGEPLNTETNSLAEKIVTESGKEEKKEKENSLKEENKSEDPYADMYEKYRKMAEEAKKKKSKDSKEGDKDKK